MVCSVLSQNCPKRVHMISLPDTPVITGKGPQVFEYYGLTADNIAKTALNALKEEGVK